MKQFLRVTLLAVSLSSCASLGPGPNPVKRTLVGATVGGAVGAAVGGINGAGLGAAAGGAVGALMPGDALEGRQYYRDSQGFCYFVDKKGKPHYKRNVRC